MNIQCIKCKGRGLCGRKYCPHILRSRAMFQLGNKLDSSEINSQSPAPFVGNYGYPHVNVGILAPPEMKKDTWQYDAPKFWAKEGFDIPSIVNMRSSLVNSRFKANIKKTDKNIELSQEVAMAKRPVDIEIGLEDKPKFRLNTDTIAAPYGPKADMKKAQITSNPRIDTKVDKIVSDTDLKANDGLNYLYEKNVDENFLSKILSVGTLGIKKNRKLVPTRWSITAVDDTLGKNLHKKILDYNQVNDYMAYFGSYLGNYYLVLMIPDVWSYELFETYMPKASWNPEDKVNFMTDFEPYQGRKKYAENCTGGYYSVRLAILEHMKKMKRQGSALVIRIITGEYSMPLGVWVTREASRNALKERPLKFSSLQLMLNYSKALIKKKFGFDADMILNKSVLLKNYKSQSKLNRFF